MELTLDRDDAALLERILSGYLSDLRMEIAGTDNPTWRRELKAEEGRVRALLEALRHLREAEASAAAP